MNFKKVSDADFSCAGDDFHVRWTIKKSLELLNFDEEGLKSLVIEDIDIDTSRKIDPTGYNLLGVDLTEYYGGTTFEKANKVIISQLKYSTQRVDKNYTFSELYKGKKSNSKDGSIIHRFGTIYKTFLDEYGRDSILEKIQIKLVGNRTLNTNHKNQIVEIQNYLKGNKRVLSFNKVLRDNPCIKEEPLEKLREATKLNLTEFTDFIRLLNFDDCGTESREVLKMDLLQSISKIGVHSKNQFNSMFQMVWEKMQPESRNERKLTFIDVVAHFGYSSKENIFPVTQNFEKKENTVRREQLEDILNIIKGNSEYLPICIHGGAGIGKSTIVNQLKSNHPNHSECILFDCYGAGRYQDSDDRRHLTRYAITQLANELAKKVGTDFLLLENEPDEVYLKEFIKRIKQGVNILRDREQLASNDVVSEQTKEFDTTSTYKQGQEQDLQGWDL